MKFRLLEAEILTYQGRRPDVIAMLNSPDVSYPTAGDLAIKRDLLCGLANARLGQGELSDRELQEARRLSDSSNSQLTGEVLRTEAQIQVYRNQLPESVNLFRKSADFARAHGDAFLEASDLLNLGLVALDMEHYDESLALLNRAADFARPIQARPVIEAALGNVGLAYFYLGDFEKALSNFQQAEHEAKEIGTTSAQVDWLWDAGRSYYKLGDLDQAKRCYEQSLKAAEAIGEPEEIVGINTVLGFLLYQQGQYDSAKEHSDEAIRTARMSGDKVAANYPLFLQALLATRQENGPNAERMLMQVDQDSADTPSLQWEIENAIGNFYMAKHQLEAADLWYRKAIDTFETQRDALKDEELKLPFFANGDALYRDYADLLIQSQRQDEALQFLDLGRARTLAEGLGQAKQKSHSPQKEAMNAQSVARKLDATILFYSLGPDKSWLWAVTANRTRLFVLPKQPEIDAHVQAYQRAILRSSDPVRDINEDARSLYETLVAPAASMIPQGSRVIIIPDGSLNGLNFETLLAPVGERLHYWIEDVTVTSANSIRLLSRIDGRSSETEKENLLLFGDPVSPAAEYENLPNAPAEIDSIQRHFAPDRRTVETRAAAVPAAYSANRPDRFSYIHFVAHGTASRLSPLDSAVVLSAPPGHSDSFKLYARDIVHQPLHARLVTISACYGSGLRAYAGEGLVGLSWAFLRAGAHNVIGALWEVNDASTSLLMDRLYTELNAGNRPDAALRTAKLSLIHSQGIYRKPLYWGAFQLYAGS
jgi:CHAT domain-containing protein/outer membrane protein assembly factor BamD (BamD/ComL family)